MSYQVINNLPVDFYFTDKTKSQLKLYKEWFEANKSERLKQLINTVKSTPKYVGWKADYTPTSLKQLGEWLKENVKTEKLTAEDYKAKRIKVPDYIQISDWDLTNETYSKLIDVGIYFGEVFISTFQGLKWEQYFSKIKNDSKQGHMVIKNFGKLELNPIRVVYITGSSMVDKKADENSLYELYENWKSFLD